MKYAKLNEQIATERKEKESLSKELGQKEQELKSFSDREAQLTKFLTNREQQNEQLLSEIASLKVSLSSATPSQAQPSFPVPFLPIASPNGAVKIPKEEPVEATPEDPDFINFL